MEAKAARTQKAEQGKRMAEKVAIGDSARPRRARQIIIFDLEVKKLPALLYTLRTLVQLYCSNLRLCPHSNSLQL